MENNWYSNWIYTSANLLCCLQTTDIQQNTLNKSGIHVWNLFDINAPFFFVAKSMETDLFWISDNKFLNKVIYLS